MAFTPLAIRSGLLLDLGDIQVWGWMEKPLTLPPGATAFGMVTTGQTQLRDAETRVFDLSAGMFFVLPDGGVARGGSGLVIVKILSQRRK